MSLTPKNAVVTGASSGMGKVIAQQLIKDGFNVIVAARRVEKMQDLVLDGAHAYRLDISDQASIDAFAAAVATDHGAVDILVNNAGFGLYGPVEEVSLERARYQFEVNLFGLGALTQVLLPGMRSTGGGKIINITSMGGKMYTPLGAWYHATKHALEGWSDCLRLELKQFNIDVVIVEPGAILTEFGDVLSDGMEPAWKEGPYGTMIQKLSDATAQAYERGVGSPAQLIADVVSTAVKARRPRTRYVAGAMARPLMFIRKYLGDRIFDRTIMRAMGM